MVYPCRKYMALGCGRFNFFQLKGKIIPGKKQEQGQANFRQAEKLPGRNSEAEKTCFFLLLRIYSAFCIMQNIFCILYFIFCVVYNALYRMFFASYILYPVLYGLSYLQYTTLYILLQQMEKLFIFDIIHTCVQYILHYI